MPEEMMSGDNSPLSPDAINAFMQMQEEEARNAAIVPIEARKAALHSYLRQWLSKAMSNRKSNRESNWNRYRRNCRNIYDPNRMSRKEKWQSTLFVPISQMHKEVGKGMLFRTLVAGLPQSIRPRPSGTIDEAKDIGTLTKREMERANTEVVMNDFLDDLLTYGTSFLKLFWEERVARRSRRVPMYEQMGIEQVAALDAGMGQPPQVVGYQKMSAEPVVVYRGVKAYHVSIWDMFFAEGASSMDDPHAQRYRMSYQEILDGVRAGWAFPDAAWKMRDVKPEKDPTEDKQERAADEKKTYQPEEQTRNQYKHIVYEWWGSIPKKWLYLREDDQHLIDDPEELVPVKALFSNAALLAVDENQDYAAESPFLSSGYVHVPGEIYHIGVAEMLEQIQNSINEDTNQRKDNIQLILNRMGVILDKALVSRADLTSRPGGWIRINSQHTDDVRKAMSWVDTPDVTSSSWQDTFNQERFAQELTGINRTTIGSGGSMAKDVTQTKGGMQILERSANERMWYYAMILEADIMMRIIRQFYKLIYDNIQPEEVARVLGPERAQFFKLRPPEEIENDYYLAPEGVFANIMRPMKIAQWQSYRDQYAGSPFFDDQHMALVLGEANEIPDLEKIIVPLRDPVTGEPIPFQMMQQLSLVGQMAAPMGPGKRTQGRPGQAGETAQPPEEEQNGQR